MKLHHIAVAPLAVCALAAPAWAAVSAEEAKALGTTLTEFGAVKAGNADGSIPAYTGKLTNLPAGYKPGSGALLPDPFKGEKPLLRVDGKNAAQYAALLTDGSKELLKRYPDFYLDVYPTHRTASYPDWVLANTLKNATTAKLAGEVIGDSVEGAYGGIPFPIPKNGYEALWNHTLRYQGSSWDMRSAGFLIDSNGKATQVSDLRMTQNNYYYDEKASSLPDKWYYKAYINFVGPAQSVGTKVLQWGSVDQSSSLSRSWVYTTGQRRTRITPEAAYDTPSTSTSGALFYEEQALYLSRLDRFDYKLAGKKEVFIPYNTYGLSLASSDQILGPKHPKPEVIRWEKHRVWVVEGVRKAGARHVYAKRTFFIDEDSWAIVASDSWDDSGAIYRSAWHFTDIPYDRGGFPPAASFTVDFVKGNYVLNALTGYPGGMRRVNEKLDETVPLNPDQLAGSGIR